MKILATSNIVFEYAEILPDGTIIMHDKNFPGDYTTPKEESNAPVIGKVDFAQNKSTGTHCTLRIEI